MGLFIRKTKTRVWSATGHVGIKKFIADKNQKAITIKIYEETGVTHSITLYASEYELLDYVIREKKFEEQVEIYK